MLLTAVLLASAVSHASALQCSDAFPPELFAPSATELEKSAQVRRDFWRSENGRLNDALKESPNKRGVEELIRRVFDRPAVLQSEDLGGDAKIELTSQGLTKSIDLVIQRGSEKEVLFSTFDYKKNNSLRFTKFTLSGDKKFVVVFAIEKGSTDTYRFFVYDLQKRVMLRDDLRSNVEAVAWEGKDRFAYRELSKNALPVMRELNLQSRQVERSSWTDMYRISQGWAVGAYAPSIYFQHPDGRRFTLAGLTPSWRMGNGPVLGATKSHLFVATKSASGYEQITRIRHSFFGKDVAETLVNPKRFFFEKSWQDGETLFVQGYIDHTRYLMVTDFDGKAVEWVVLPDGANVSTVKWDVSGKTLSMTLTSAIAARNVTFDFASKKFTEDDLARKLLQVNGVEYESRIVEAVSADGTKVPVRLMMREGLRPADIKGALIDVYGGFGVPGRFYGDYDPRKVEFMNRGGLLVAPAVRGGNELGVEWHEAAKGARKERTLEDLIATARFLIDQGFATAERIVTRGTSNGGMVVAAAALKDPSVFGLVIPLNGVQNMLAKDSYDPNFNGWADEYGNATVDHVIDYIQHFSPVKRAGEVTATPNMLIMLGANDTRVNPIHSSQLASALLANPALDPAKIHLSTVKNSGHWHSSVGYQGTVAWRVQSVIWTRIFDQLGVAP